MPFLVVLLLLVNVEYDLYIIEIIQEEMKTMHLARGVFLLPLTAE